MIKEYDLEYVDRLTHSKVLKVIDDKGYKITGFVLAGDDGGKCIVNTGDVRWFDKPECFIKMMHPDFKRIEEVQ